MLDPGVHIQTEQPAGNGPDAPPEVPSATTADAGPDLREAAAVVVQALRRRWAEPDFRPGSGSRPVRVHTGAPDGAVRLPESGHLVRGVAGAAAHASRASWYDSGPPTTETAVYASVPLTARAAPRAERAAPTAGSREVSDAYLGLLHAVADHPVLAQRVFEGRGFKHYEPAELAARAAELRGAGDDARLEDLGYPVARLLVQAFQEEDFTWEARDTFVGWDRVAGRLTTILGEVGARAFYDYEAVAYLNGPLIDAPDGVSLGPLAPGAFDVVLAYATDAALARAAESGLGPSYPDLPPGVRTANTTLTLRLCIPVDAPVASFLNAYPTAAELVARVVDVLRIVHGGDIGVAALRLHERSPHTPTIRRTYATQFEPEVAHHVARRLSYAGPGDPADEVLGAAELDTVRALVPRWLAGVEQRGLAVAVARFRDSYERYSPDDPTRLLDVAIALEALLLNDGDKRDVGYRLRVRGARWLADAYEERRAVAATLRDLYEFRSRIAHGDTPATLGAKDRARLEAVLRDAPTLLRRALRASIEGRGPESLAGEKLHEFWQRVELS